MMSALFFSPLNDPSSSFMDCSSTTPSSSSSSSSAAAEVAALEGSPAAADSFLLTSPVRGLDQQQNQQQLAPFPFRPTLQQQQQPQQQSSLLSDSFVVSVPCFTRSLSLSSTGSSSGHSNPFLLEGFSLEASAAAAPSPPRKRKEPSSSVQAGFAPVSTAEGELDERASKRSRRSCGKSLLSVQVPIHSGFEGDVSSTSPSTILLSSGTTSPVLAMMQAASGSSNVSSRTNSPVERQAAVSHSSVAVPLSKEEQRELKRHRKAMRLLKLEKSIAALQAQLAHTQEVAEACASRAEQLASQASIGSGAAMVEGFFAGSTPSPTAADVSAATSIVIDSPASLSPSSSASASASASAERASLPPLSPMDIGLSASPCTRSVASSRTSSSGAASDASTHRMDLVAPAGGMTELMINYSQERLVALAAGGSLVSSLDDLFSSSCDASDALAFVEHVLLPRGEASQEQLEQIQAMCGGQHQQQQEQEESLLLEHEWQVGVSEFTQAMTKAAHHQSGVLQRQAMALAMC